MRPYVTLCNIAVNGIVDLLDICAVPAQNVIDYSEIAVGGKDPAEALVILRVFLDSAYGFLNSRLYLSASFAYGECADSA